DSPSGNTHIYMRQSVNGLPILNANLSINVTGDGRVVNLYSRFISLANASGVSAVPAMDALSALQSAAGVFGLNLSATPTVVSAAAGTDQLTTLQSADASIDPIPARLHYVETADGLKLAWDLVLRTPHAPHWYDASVDAGSGAMVFAADWVD